MHANIVLIFAEPLTTNTGSGSIPGPVQSGLERVPHVVYVGKTLRKWGEIERCDPGSWYVAMVVVMMVMVAMNVVGRVVGMLVIQNCLARINLKQKVKYLLKITSKTSLQKHIQIKNKVLCSIKNQLGE